MKKFLIGFSIASIVYFIINKIIEKKTAYTEIENCKGCPVYVDKDGSCTAYMYQD